ncbi:putative DUF2339 domain-containing protein [uncultured Gammaproteobacteria bacterium]
MDWDDGMMLLFLTVGLMAWIALRRTKAIAKELKAAQARLVVLETALAIVPPVPPPPPIVYETAIPEAASVSSPGEAVPVPSTTDWLAGRGMVWVGALALGFAGLFLIRYSIENAVLGPLARVIAGLCLGSALITIGEWLTRRSPPPPVAPAIAPAGSACPTTAIPPVTAQTALIGSGVCTLFAASYGAYAFYGLIGPLPAFVLLTMIAFAAMLMALRHGPIIALIGLAGALVLPALVAGGEPSPWALFLYLAAVIITCLAVVRRCGWWWLGWVALAGAVGWALLWLADHHTDYDTLITGGFAFVVLIVVPVGLQLAETIPETSAESASARWLWGSPPPLALVITATAGAALILFVGVRQENYGLTALVWMGVAGGFTQWAALHQPRLIALPWLVASFAVLAYAAWAVPLPHDSGWIGVVEGEATGHLPHALIEPAFMSFSLTGLAIAALFGLGGWRGVLSAAKTGPWSSLSVLMPLLVLIIAYTRTSASSISPPWALASLALGGVLLTATTTLHRRRELPSRLAISVAIYAAGVTAAATLAMVMVLQDFWLTVAISLQLPALAWIERETRVPEMRRIALALAAIVLLRLVFNPGIAGYHIGTTPILNGLLYGYGLPLIAFRAAQRMFRTNRLRPGGEPLPSNDLLDDGLEAGWIGFLTLLVSLQLRHLVGHGTITNITYGALEQGLQVTWWGCLALGLMRADRDGSRRVLGWAWRLSAVAALGHVLIFALFDWNPLWRGYSVGEWPLFNLVTLNYGVPAVLAAVGTWQARRRRLAISQRIAGVAAFVLAWTFVTLTVRQAFQGTDLAWATPSDPEWYAYSAAWLVYGGGLLALGVRLDVAALRSASMAVIIATVIKVFLYDMSTLAGLLRVASFLGLGLALILIGWIHQTALKTLKPVASPPDS